MGSPSTPVRRSSCPSCSAGLTFPSLDAFLATCPSCRLAVLRTDSSAADIAYKPGVIEIRISPAHREAPPADDAEEARVTPLVCGACGGELRHEELSPREVFTCRYCESAIECRHVLAERPVFAPRTPTDPYIPVGLRGTLRGKDVAVTGFVAFTLESGDGTDHYLEYLLDLAPRAESPRILEQNGDFYLVRPLRADDVEVEDSPFQQRPHKAVYAGDTYYWRHTLPLRLDRAVQVIDPSVDPERGAMTDCFTLGPDLVRVENRGARESHASYCEKLGRLEIADAFEIRYLPPGPQARRQAKIPGFVERADGCLEAIGPVYVAAIVIFGLVVVLLGRC